MQTLLNKILLICLLPLALNSAQAAMYKTVDKNGNVTYSDSPGENAKELDLPPIPLINLTPSPEIGSSDTRPSEGEEQATSYTQLAITLPKNNATIRDNAGNISVKLSISPELAEEDTVVLKVDGKEVSRGRSNSHSISQLDRGSHSVQAVIIGTNETPLLSSEAVTFHLQRHFKR